MPNRSPIFAGLRENLSLTMRSKQHFVGLAALMATVPAVIGQATITCKMLVRCEMHTSIDCR